MSTNNISMPVDRSKRHMLISMFLLAGLLLLRFPFLIITDLMLSEGATARTIVYFIFSVGTYLLTAILIWWERDRLKEFWIDLAGAITFLFQSHFFPIGIGLFWAMRRNHVRFPSPPTRMWRWAVAGAVIAIACNIFTMKLGLFPPDTRSVEPAGFPFLIFAIFIQMTNAAVWEEPLFRGFLWGYLRLARWKDGWIWLFQAALFTLGHVYYLKTEAFAPWLIRLLLPSLIIGFIAWRAKSIFASMVTHGVLNASGDMLMHTSSLSGAMRICWSMILILIVLLAGILLLEWLIRRRNHSTG